MTFTRKVLTVPAVMVGNTWMPDIPQVPAGVNWTLLEYDKANGNMTIEIWGSDHVSVSSKASPAQINAYIATASKGTVIPSHVKSPAKIGAFWNGNTLIEEG